MKTHKFALNRREALVGVAASMIMASTNPSVAQTPKKGGRLRVALAAGATSDTVDPAVMDSAFTIPIAYTAFNHLTETDSSGNVVPELSDEWSSEKSPAEWTFRLRKGVEFHNGKTMTAADVIASLNYHRGENSKSAAKPFLDAVEELRADGSDRIRVRLKAPNVDFPSTISDYHFVILPSTDGKIDPLAGIGTGPYVLQKLDPGVGASFSRNSNYFKSDRAFFDEVELRAVIDDAARNNALLTGEVDGIDQIPLQIASRLKQVPAIKIVETVGTEHNTLPMRTDIAPFNDVNVRMAIKHAIDRDAIVDKIMFGYAKPGNDNPISRAYRYFDSSLELRKYDPEKAKWYLKQAGLSSLQVDLSVAGSPFPGAVETGSLVQDAARAAGIEVNVIREVDDGYWSNVWMQRPWCAASWVGPASEDWIFTNAYAQGAAWNDTFWKNERFNQLLVHARGEQNDNLRREMYAEMQRLVRDDGGAVVLTYNSYVMGLRDNVEHGPLAANWRLDGYKFAERWWFS
ncbi:ABC transporter substrate-binding protein [Mesorhizobium escarrei]|uniref:Hemin-binding lipoprotein n=1 Tax=Mesorhizobium escarrei TaxID=666018 RepID=A0ABM9DM80_9HYPH|nr:ABC transporter substrate-binding protein [Mesorhizobium escarrei]CAH2397055.1 Hemin-binding lipoprotein [Mesorhizobium escarrei]